MLVELFNAQGRSVTKNGVAVQLQKTVPANGTLQINDAEELFDAAPLPGAYAYARVTWKSSATDSTGAPKGAVVGMATVIDNRTQDSSLHVGVSTNALNPSYVPTSGLASSRTALASLPFGGAPAPLLVPDGPLVRRGARERREAVLADARDAHEHVGGAARRHARVPRRRATRPSRGSSASVSRPEASSPSRTFSRNGWESCPDRTPTGAIRIAAAKNNDGTWASGWAGVDVQTETYTVDPVQGVGDYKTGMEGYAYFHGYSSFQSNLGTMSFDGAENSSSYRTNLILNEVGGASCDVIISAYMPGSFVPVASVTKRLAPNGYFSDELFTNVLGLNLTEVTDVRVVVRQIAGDGVFLAFASKIDRASGDPANIFLRPAAAGTGR